jgi:hypothetical protein
MHCLTVMDKVVLESVSRESSPTTWEQLGTGNLIMRMREVCSSLAHARMG